MRLVPRDGVTVLEPDDPEELRPDEPDTDDAEAMDTVRIFNVDGYYWDGARGVWVRPVTSQELD